MIDDEGKPFTGQIVPHSPSDDGADLRDDVGGRIPSDPQRLFVFAVTYLFFNLLFFLMIHRGNTDPYRAIAFITYALLFLDTITGKGSLTPYDESVIAVQTLVKVKGGWVARIHLRKIS